MKLKALILSVITVSIIGLSACSGGSGSSYPVEPEDQRKLKHGKLTGEDGINLFGGGNDKKSAGSSGIGVNSFLWRASLDTLSFLPLSSVDPRGGVIITEWYEDPNARGERFKVNVLILGTALRSDGVRVTVFRQALDQASGEWRDMKVAEGTARDIEDRILTRARELRIQNTDM